VAGGFTGRLDVGLSALYGAGVVVGPALLMARAATSRSALSLPGYAAVSFMMWEFGKILVSVALLALAPKLLHNVVWPALLAGLIVCIKIYWVALLWRGSKKR
jgi:ATP synthase protein I